MYVEKYRSGEKREKENVLNFIFVTEYFFFFPPRTEIACTSRCSKQRVIMFFSAFRPSRTRIFYDSREKSLLLFNLITNTSRIHEKIERIVKIVFQKDDQITRTVVKLLSSKMCLSSFSELNWHFPKKSIIRWTSQSWLCKTFVPMKGVHTTILTAGSDTCFLREFVALWKCVFWTSSS